MLKVGLTGGVACGKSTIAAMFEKRGAHVIRADEIAHELMAPGEPVYDAVVEHFGKGIVNEDGTINRPRLGGIAFAGRIKELNALVHPSVVAYQDEWMEGIGRTHPHGIAMVEAALILEAGAKSHFDKLITVTCDFEQKAQRFARRAKVSIEAAREEVRRRMAWQLPDEEKVAAADYLVDNSGTLEEAEVQVDDLWSRLKTTEAALKS